MASERPLVNFRKGRGAMGVIGIQTSERNGVVVGAAQVVDDDDLLLITNGGTDGAHNLVTISQCLVAIPRA